MRNNTLKNSRHLFSRRLFFITIFVLVSATSWAHPSPNSLVFLDISPDRVKAELQLPLPELELAFGNNITRDPENAVKLYGPQIKEYLKAHIHPYVKKGLPWLVEVVDMRMDKGQPVDNGPLYWEVIVHLVLQPQPGETTRAFNFDYDVIIHQVINHVAFVSVRNDWEAGATGEKPVELGIIRWDMKDNVIYPLAVNLEEGSWWKGCKSMLKLGMHHIREGIDHLLFLLVLLLPAPLLLNGRRWGHSGGTKHSVIHLLKIVTAFTIGHSITLLIGAAGWFKLPAQPVEILIAVSILVSAIHAIYPLFPGKEAYIAAGFGLIHGLAFAAILSNLQTGPGVLALSILSFNLGIELMQLLIIAMVIPWLILMSKTPFYNWFRICGALLAAVAALAWIVERSSGKVNFVTELVLEYVQYDVWLVLFIAVVTVTAYGWYRYCENHGCRNSRGASV